MITARFLPVAAAVGMIALSGLAHAQQLSGPTTRTPVLSVTGTTASTSPTTGALTVAGGAGIGGTLNVGGAISGDVTPSRGTAASSLAALASRTFSVTDNGAICDGSAHPLSGRYASLAAAQADYPFVTALTQQIDYAAIQKTINDAEAAGNAIGGWVRFARRAYCEIATSLVITGSNIRFGADNPLGSGEPVTSGESNYDPIVYNPRIRWIGSASASPFYMLTVAPVTGDTAVYQAGNRVSATFDCHAIAGCGGVLVESNIRFRIRGSVWNPSPALYTTSGSTGAGSQTIDVTDATGIAVGEQIEHADVPVGCFVEGVSGNTVTMSCQAQTTIADASSIGFGGEGYRFDVTGPLRSNNNTQRGDLDISVQNIGSGLQGPGVVFGGSNVVGAAGGTGHTVYGNTNFMTGFIHCNAAFSGNVCAEFSNSDHNFLDFIDGTVNMSCGLAGDTAHGGARYLQLRHWIGSAFTLQGTEIAGCSDTAKGLTIDSIENGNGSPDPTIGTGVTYVMWKRDKDAIWRQPAVALTDTGTIAVDAALGKVFTVTLGGSRALGNPANLTAGQTLVFVVSQDGTGGRTLSYGSDYKWPGGAAPTLTTAANAKDKITCEADTATSLLCHADLDVK